MATPKLTPFDGQLDDETPASTLKPFAGQLDGEKPRTRGLFEAVNDNVIEFANAAAGGVSALANFVKPGNAVSGFIDENIIKAGEAKQSDVVQGAKRQLSQGLDSAQGIGEEVGAVGRYVLDNPLLAASQAAGSFALPAGTVKGAGMAAKALGAGVKGVETAGRVGGIAAGAAMAGGDAAGTAYDLSSQAGATEEQALAAGRQASVIPALVGGVTGAFGAERLLAGAKGFGGNALSRGLKSGLSEAGQEAVEEGVTQFEGQRAAMPYDSTIDLTKGVAGAAAMGGIMGFGPGAVLGAMGDGAAKPSQQMGIDPGAGPLSRAAAASVDSQPVPQPLGASITGTAPADLMGRATDPLAAQIASGRQKSEDLAVTRNSFADRNSEALAGGGLFGSRADPLANMIADQRSSEASTAANIDRAAQNRAPMTATEAGNMLVAAREQGRDFTVAPHPDGGFVVVPREWVTPQVAAKAEASLMETLGRVAQVEDAPINRAARVSTEPANLNLNTDPVTGYVDNLRSVNTPAARMFVSEFDAGRITRRDVERRMAAEKGKTADERIAEAAAQAKKPEDPYSLGNIAQSRPEQAPEPLIEIPRTNKLKEARDERRAADVLRGTRNSSSGAGADIADAGVANDVGGSDRTTGAAAPVVPEQGQPSAGERPAADQASLRPDNWRGNAIKAGKVARSLGLDPKGKRLKEIVAEIDAVDAGTNVQNTPSSTAGTEAKASPVEARAPEGGNAATNGSVPAAGAGSGVRTDGVSPGGYTELERQANRVASGLFGKDVYPKAIQNDWQRLLDAMQSKDAAKLKALREKYRADMERDGLGSGTSGAGPGKVKQARRGAAQLARFALEAERELSAKTGAGDVQADGVKAENDAAPAAQAEKPAEPVNPEPSKAAQPKAEKPAEDDAFMGVKKDDPRNLVAMHNLTADNLLYADSIGGIPVPSIGITKIDSPFNGFGDVTLIAPSSMVDPEQGTPVFDRDAWTARFPTMNFKKVKAKVADAFYERMKPVDGMGNDGGQFLSMLWEETRNASVQRPDKVADLFRRHNAPKMLYAKDVLGKEIKVPMRAAQLSSPAAEDKQLQAYWKKNGNRLIALDREMSGFDFSNSPEYKAFMAEIEGAVRRYAIANDKADRADSYVEMFLPGGQLGPGGFNRIRKDFEQVGKKEVDGVKLSEAVRKAVPDNDPAYDRWVKSLVEPLFEAPTITVRGREVEPTLENIVDAMTVGATAGAEKSLTFGPGKTAAMLGKRFKSLSEIKADRDRVVSQDQENEGKKATEELLNQYRAKATAFFKGTDWRGNIDTWAANDASMEALAKAGKAGGSNADIRQALVRAGFKQVDQATVDLASESIKALRTAATDYFEAKPQRAVKLSEFRAAVVPKGVSQEVKDVLTKNGIEVVEYNKKTEGARDAAIQKTAKRVDKAAKDILFMGDKAKAQRQGTPVDRAIMEMAGEGREANEILSFIAKSSKSPYRRQLAQKLLENGANPSVSLGSKLDGGKNFREGFFFIAQYSRKRHEITLSELATGKAEQAFLHEMAHAATLMALDKGGLIATQMNRLYESVKKQGVADGQYGMKNVGEFVAEAFTNPEFQQTLSGIQVSGVTVWERFVNMVRRAIGLPITYTDALSKSMELGAELMRENMPLRAAKSFRAEDGPAYMRTEDTRAAFDARIDELFSGAQANRVGTRVLDRSDVMSMLGYDDKPMVLAESKVTQGMENHPEMTADVWKKIPGWLENPAAVFDSDTDGGLVVIAPEMVGGKAVSIIVRPDGERRNALNVHLLLNAYSRSPNTPYQRWISQGLLRYVDQKKFPALFEAVAGRQLPGTALQNKPGTKRILTEKNLVGWRKANPEDEANFGVADAVEQIKQFDVKSAPKSAWAHYRGMALQALGRRQLVDLYAEELPQLETYNDLVQQMDAEKNDTGAEADRVAQDWGSLKGGMDRKLAELMHDATLAKMDPDKPMPAGYFKRDYDALKARFDALSPEAKTLYRKARDMYVDHYKAVQQAIKDRVERSEMSEGQKRKMMADLDDKLFKELKGVYFPLARFGQYVIVVKDANGEVVNVTRAETVKEAEQARKELQKAFPASSGNTVGKVLKQAEFNAGRDAVGKGFMADLMGALDEKGVDDELRDTVAQLYLSSLPDLSWAKHGIHRKGTPGFSQDARRAFAQNMFHGARYLAKLRHADRLQDLLIEMQDHIKAYEGVEEYDSVQAQQVVDEMVKRHEWLMNPKASPVSTALTSFGFLFHMGLSPASAMVNLTQTALVAYPQMGAKWGFARAGAALTKASEETVRAKNDLSQVLKGDELDAFNRAVKDGTIDVTMAHDLAGIAQGEDQGVMWKIRPVMRWASFMFHHAEKFNRQATFLAAYRLAKAANPAATPSQLYDQAKQATYDGHFDYSSSNRARIMQGNWQRVIFLFKQYAQSMVYTLARNAYQSVKALDPKERSQARKTLAGILAAHAAAAGVLGLPIVGPLLTVASWIGGDDDEPWDAEVAMQNAMAEMIGPKAAEVMARGFSRLTPFDLSGRVALNKLILPDVQEGLEGKEWAESAMAAALGPVAGIGVNMARGAQKITEGDYLRGLEDMMPTALRGPLKAMRYASEGAVDKTGVTITEDVSAAGVLGQASGFSPSQVRRDTERRSAIYSYDRALLERRSVLMRMFAQAQMSGDTETAQEVREDIQRFNEKNPTRRITPMNLAASIRNRRKRIEEAEQGVYLPSKRRDALDAVTF